MTVTVVPSPCSQGTHCAHPTGYTLASIPPIVGVRCCHCGAHGQQKYETLPMVGHGPHAGMVDYAKPIEWKETS